MIIVAIIQARAGSTRLPGKVMYNLAGKPIIWHIYHRLTSSVRINRVILATTTNYADDILQNWAWENRIECYRGSEVDVLDRFYQAATEYKADVIVRVTGDDPFKDGALIDKVIDLLIREELDFACNNFPPSFPEGLDVEVFTYSALVKAFENSNCHFEREHVTQYFYRNPNLFKIKNYSYEGDLSCLRLTVDTINDFKLAEEIYNRLYINNEHFGFDKILSLFKSEPDLFKLNQNESRSEMYK